MTKLIKDYALIQEALDNNASVILRAIGEDDIVLSEMKDAPDNAGPGLSPEEIEKLMWTFQHQDTRGAFYIQDEPHSVLGMKRVLWHPDYDGGELNRADLLPKTGEMHAPLEPVDFYFHPGDTRLNELYNPNDDSTTLNMLVDLFLQDAMHPAGEEPEALEYLLDGDVSVFLDKEVMSHLRDHNMLERLFSPDIDNIEHIQHILNQVYPHAMTDPAMYNNVQKNAAIYDHHKGFSETSIKESLDRVKESLLEDLYESKGYKKPKNNRHHRNYGRMSVVDRIRGGKVQIRKKMSAVKGYRIQSGRLIRMSVTEMLRRKKGARIASRKRHSQMAKILRHRKISMRKRNLRFGN